MAILVPTAVCKILLKFVTYSTVLYLTLQMSVISDFATEPDRAASMESAQTRLSALNALASHWPEYLMEAAELGTFMISACLVTALLEHPSSIIHQLLPSALLRRFLTGIAMATTAVAIIYSPIGQRSGAHFNPSVTLSYLRLKKIESWDAIFYIVAQFLGGIAGVGISSLVLGTAIAEPNVNYAATLPGPGGPSIAFAAEVVISFFLFLTVLAISNHTKLSRYTPLFVGALVATYITLEAPLSGMSMNPARTLASAFFPHHFTGLWIYFVAPIAGMLLAAELYVRLRSERDVYCAKFHHHNSHRCIFRCRFRMIVGSSVSAPGI